MDSFGLDILAILFLVGAVAGWVDAIAGGGGLISVPALLWVGLTPAQALGTNKLQGSFGTLSATIHFVRRGMINLRQIMPAVLCAFIGAAMGAIVVQSVNPGFMTAIVPVLLIGAALYFLIAPKVNDVDSQQRMKMSLFSLLIGGGVGFYDGFFGPGAGSFFTIACVSLLGFGLTRAVAHTKLLNFTSNLAALMFFVIGGNVVWKVGLCMAAGQILGARLGSSMVLTHGRKLIRPMLVIMCLVMTVKLVADDPDNYWRQLFISADSESAPSMPQHEPVPKVTWDESQAHQ